ncbi:MAG: hypothetical protein RH917_03445 [Lacipirellulaceae bacterium]
MDEKTLGSHTLDTLTLGNQRRLAKRLAPWALSLGLFAAGGWSVYKVATPVDSGDQAAVSDESSELRSAQLEQLFGGDKQNEVGTEVAAPATRYGSDRYAAPALPPRVEAPELADNSDDAEPVNPFESAPTAKPQAAMENDRYASHSVETASYEDASDEEITRGQNPDAGNPLRAAQQVDLAAAEESRAAFRDDYVEQAPAQPLKVAARPRETNVESALPAAKPLGGSRYGGGQAAPIPVGASPTVAEPSVPDFRSASATPRAETAPAMPAMPAEQPAYLRNPAQGNAAQAVQSQAPTNDLREAPLRETQSLDASTYSYGNDSYQNRQTDAPQRPTPSQPLDTAFASRRTADSRAVTPTPGINNTPGTGRPGEGGLEGAQSPSIAIQKLAPEEIQVGKKCTFAIRIKNIGQRAAQSVVINDEVPLGTKLVGTSPRANVSASQVKWDLGTLSVGEERIVEMELMPTDEGELGSVATVTFAAQASAKARSTRPELALRMNTKPRVMAGNRHLVQIEVSNPGTGDATGVMLFETLPQGVSHEAGTALEFEVGTLRAGESRKLDLVLNAEQAGIIENVMTARADANLEVTSSCEFEIIAPDLKLSVDGPKRKYLERPATFTVIVDNPGTASAKDVELVTQLPKGLQFVSANNMGEYDSATHSVYWSLAELPANERGSVELTALPVEAGAHTVKAATRSQQGLEDRAERQLQVEGLAALKFEVVDSVDPVEIGSETTYEIRVMNQGSKAAANVQIVATLPEGMRAIDARGETRHAIQGNRVVFTPLAQLTPKAESVYRIQVQGVRPGDQRVKVQITTDEIQQPITKEESTRVYADQ